MELLRLYILFVLALTPCYGEIIIAHKLEECMKVFEEADSDTLVLFDIDMVLTQPSDPAFQMPNMKKHKAIVKEVYGQLPSHKLEIYLSLMYVGNDAILVDESIPQIIADLNRKNVPTMALTANLTGSLAAVSSIENHKAQCLKKLGIFFSLENICKDKIIFTDLNAYRHSYPTYFEGMLFTNGVSNSKGKTLLAFLKETGIKPQRIIFLDDREENLKSVEQALKETSIEFLGYHYLVAQNYPSIELPEDVFTEKWTQLSKKAQELE